MPITVAWPASLPQGPAQFSETRKPVTISTQPDDGPSKVRKRFTKAVYVGRMSFSLTLAQRNALDTFYATTLDGGLNSTTFLHPWLQSSVVLRITEPPTYSSEGPLGASASFAFERT